MCPDRRVWSGIFLLWFLSAESSDSNIERFQLHERIHKFQPGAVDVSKTNGATSDWCEDVGKRYSELKPPVRKRSSVPHPMMKGELFRKLSEEQLRTPGSQNAFSFKLEKGVLMLDLDKTALWGNDGNDLGISLQWMERPHEAVQDLYNFLINPALKPAFETFKAQFNNISVVIYTMRSSLLLYRSNFRGITIPVQYSRDWHKDGQLYIPPHIETADEIMGEYSGPELIQEEIVDVSHAMERLLAAREAIRRALGLEVGSIPTVVTVSHKDVGRTAMDLGFKPDCAFLWDDNARLTGCTGVINVPAYISLDAPTHRKLSEFLERTMPAEQLDADLVDFISSAAAGECMLARDPLTGRIKWSLPLDDQPSSPWHVPRITAGGNRVAWQEEGLGSPVTPPSGASQDADGRRMLHRTRADVSRD